jgi:hypothetical protein
MISTALGVGKIDRSSASNFLIRARIETVHDGFVTSFS